MDFSSLKKGFADLKSKAKDKLDDALEYGAKKIADSRGITIQNKEELQKLIRQSETTSFTSEKTGETKLFTHTSIVIFASEKSEYFQSALLHFPVLAAKAFSQNINLKLGKADIEGVDYSSYGISELPAMVVFREEQHYKTILGEDNIEKLVKSVNLDINKQIDELTD